MRLQERVRNDGSPMTTKVSPMARTLPALSVLLLLAACESGQGGDAGGAAEPVAVGDAFCRPTPTGRLMTACYVTLTARADDRLVGVTAAGAGRVELHETRMESGMMMMRPLENGLPLPQGRLVELEPGGNHLMLMGLSGPLETGDSLELTLDFDKAPDAKVTAWVRQPDAE
jgi:copper(I)-binding protein